MERWRWDSWIVAREPKPAERKHFNPVGVPKNKTDLRAHLQEEVLRFTSELRAREVREGETDPSKLTPLVEEYDPVVIMAIMSVDVKHVPLDTRLRCCSEVAQYTRPKLKSVEHTVDPEQLETLEQRRLLSERLVGLLEAKAAGKKKGGK